MPGRVIPGRVIPGRVIRTAVRAETGAIIALHARARATYHPGGVPQDGPDWVSAWRTAIARPDGQVLCLVEAGRIVGVASFRTPEEGPADLVKLFQFHIDPDHWRTGAGTALHTACVEQWHADARTAAVLDVRTGNTRAQAFYARQGWTPDPARPPAESDHHRCLRLALRADGTGADAGARAGE